MIEFEGYSDVERVAVGEQEVDIAVAVQVRRGEIAEAPVRMGPAVDHVLLEATVRLVEERDELVLLRERHRKTPTGSQVEPFQGHE